MLAEQEYKLLLPDLEILYPELSGQWSEDEAAFTKIWKDNQELFKKLRINDE